MSGVALRCATCGTTQDRPGECEACSDGEVRYFCGNHSPGLWLDEPVCTRCGAKFGEAPRRDPVFPSRPSLPPLATRRAESRSPKPSAAAPRRDGASGRSVSVEDSEDIPTTPSLAELLAAMAERTRGRYRTEGVWTELPAERRSRGLPVMGCLFRLVLFILVLIALILSGLFFVLGGAFS
jgi:hypothetical protein